MQDISTLPIRSQVPAGAADLVCGQHEPHLQVQIGPNLRSNDVYGMAIRMRPELNAASVIGDDVEQMMGP